MMRVLSPFICMVLAATLMWPQIIILPKKKAGGPTYLINENCEGTGTPSGWTDTNSPDWDNTAVVLSGSQSLALVAANPAPRTHYDLSSAYSEIWLRFQVRTSSFGGTNSRTVRLMTQSGGTEIAYVRWTSGGDLRAYQGAVFAGASASMSVDTTYYVWVRYKAGTGSNGEMTVGYSTNGTEPTSGTTFASFSNGTATASIDRIQVETGATSANTTYFDNIVVNDSAIGSVE